MLKRDNKHYGNDKKFLVFYKCNKCGKQSCKMGSVGDKFPCFCGEEKTLNRFENASYSCPNCTQVARFKINKGDNITEVKCKTCDSLLDMKFHKEKNSWLSLNMFK